MRLEGKRAAPPLELRDDRRAQPVAVRLRERGAPAADRALADLLLRRAVRRREEVLVRAHVREAALARDLGRLGRAQRDAEEARDAAELGAKVALEQ